MPAKKKPVASDTPELDAPSVLRRLQSDAAKFAAQIDDAESRLGVFQAISPNAAETKENREQIARIECELITARKNFSDTAKTLLNYDSKVKEERREGEKLLVSEAKEIYRQLVLSLNLALEQRLLADAQSAALAQSPEEFYTASAENWRAARDTAIDTAKKEGAIPDWVLE
jgi:hypothetical protein